ncbi:MAG: 3-hydroxyacyl-CoA dehydrogenase NAD-binding domain-containing protein [Balneolaceae bacterium]|nr:3-hydroxyacyl-CoA dehydrogenase NAD-binding domain-containing protein [Balneolaceae bacterium]MDR9446942.1 3-hydroxyacyl-CoA dehydrogenase NAD-binding domain-containing protein [Balneolaceae bacterium]
MSASDSTKTPAAENSPQTHPKIAVIGGGTMGNGIAHVFAQSGHQVTLVDVAQEACERAIATIDKNLGRMVTKEKLTEAEKTDTLARLSTSVSIQEGCQKAGLVVEAVPEVYSLKRDVYKEVEAVVDASAVIATNTSSISITKLASGLEHSSRFIGMHFFNPVPVMSLVEVVKGHQTDPAVVDAVMGWSQGLDKVPVPVNDSPGFVSNRVLMPMINEAIFAVYEGVATPEHVDEVMKRGMAHPMGPLRLADFIGLDVCLDILRVLYDGFQDPKYRPCPLLVKMVDAGTLGDKTGQGFYEYS